MLQRFYMQLPDFARPANPLLRYIYLRNGQNIRQRALQALILLVAAAALVFVGYQIATANGTVPLDAPTALDKVYLVLYWPLVIIQLAIRLLALSSTVGTISAETQRGTWDILKVTTDGARLLMKSRWASVFYRVWYALAILLLIRLFFVVVALINVGAYQGNYLDLLLSGTTPFGPPNIPKDASTVIGIVVVAIMMTASLLAPFTAVAFDAALGLWVGTFARGRFAGVLAQVLLMVARLAVTGWALWVGAFALAMSPFAVSANAGFASVGASPLSSWLGAFFGIAEGDSALTLLHLDHVQRLWTELDYGVLIGVAVLGWVLLQAVLSNVLVNWAGRRAAKADKV